MNLFNRFFSKHINRVIQSIIRLVLFVRRLCPLPTKQGIIEYRRIYMIYGEKMADTYSVSSVIQICMNHSIPLF